jgi:hypothetical protein
VVVVVKRRVGMGRRCLELLGMMNWVCGGVVCVKVLSREVARRACERLCAGLEQDD